MGSPECPRCGAEVDEDLLEELRLEPDEHHEMRCSCGAKLRVECVKYYVVEED